MAFSFSLEAVLRLRQGMEHQQELRLRAVHQQVARVRHGIERIDHALGEAEQRSSSTLASGTTSAELLFALQSETVLLEHREKLGVELARLAKLRDQQAEISARPGGSARRLRACAISNSENTSARRCVASNGESMICISCAAITSSMDRMCRA